MTTANDPGFPAPHGPSTGVRELARSRTFPRAGSRFLRVAAVLSLGTAAFVIPHGIAGRSHGVLAKKKAPVFHPELGVDLLASGPLTTATVETRDEQILVALKQDLGIDSVSFNFFLQQTGATTGLVVDGPHSLQPASLLLLGKEAEHLGLSVVIRPFIQLGPCSKGRPATQVCGWDGYINPVNKPKWFESLYTAELPYLEVAKQLHAQRFIVGTELAHLSGSPYWNGLFKRDAAIAPSVALECTSSTYDYFPRHKKPQPLPPNKNYSRYGLDFYPVSGSQRNLLPFPHLSFKPLGANTPATTLTTLMEKLLKTVNGTVLRKTTMEEVGMAAAPGGYIEPSQWHTLDKEPLDIPVQAKWFTAVCRTVAALKMKGVFFYDVNLADNPAAWPPGNTNFMGKKLSMSAIKGCATDFGIK